MSERTLVPSRFRRVGNHALVEMVDPERLDWRAGFFHLGLPARRPADAIVPYARWRAEAEAKPQPEFGSTGAIFHVSRCGSTLLAQNLKAGGALALGEPSFMRILRQRLGGSIDRHEAMRAIAYVIAQWQNYARTQGRRLVIKFNSQAHEEVTDLLAALPRAQFVFLHREPLPVLESLVRKPPRFLLRENRDEPPAALAGLDDDPLLVDGAARYLATIDAMAGLRHPRLLEVGYRDLATRYGEVARHLLGPDATPAEWCAETDAKAADPAEAARYRPVTDETLARFSDAHRKLLDVVEARYRSAFCRAAAMAGRP